MGEHVDLGESITTELGDQPRILGASIIADEGKALFSSLPSSTLRIAMRIGREMLSVSGIGDYSVKKLKNSSLIVMRISDSLVLALEGQELEGVLISLANRLASKINEALGQEAPPVEGTQARQVAPVAASLTPNAVPELRPGSAEVVLDGDTIKVLRAIDGSSDVASIARATGLGLEETKAIISHLVASGLVALAKVGPEVEAPRPPALPTRLLLRPVVKERVPTKPIRPEDLRHLEKVVYVLDDRFKSREEALSAISPSDELLVFILNNINDGLSALDCIRMAIAEGLAENPHAVLAALESLRSMGIIRRKGEKRTARHELERSLPSTSTSVLLLGRM